MSKTGSPLHGRDAAMAALARWAARKSALDAERSALIVAAWNAGERVIANLHRAAGVSRDTVYADLAAAGIDYKTKGDDPRIARVLAAVTALSAALAPGALTPPLFWKTPATLNPLIGNALLALAGGAGPGLVPAVRDVLAAQELLVPEDQEALRPFLHEVGEAFAQYAVPLLPVRPSPRPGNPLLRAATRPAGRLPEAGN